MRTDYPVGTKIKLLGTGLPGVIVGTYHGASMTMMYKIVLDGKTTEMLMRPDDIAPVDHPFHSKMEVWRAEGIKRGYKSIVIGTTDKAYKCFYCNTQEEYNAILRNNPDITFQYYWSL